MNILILLAVLAVLAILRWLKVNLLLMILAVWLGIYLVIKHAFLTPIPASVVTIYMGIATLSLVAYVASSRARWEAASTPFLRLIVEKRYLPLLVVIVVLIPAVAATQVYLKEAAPLEAPTFPRTVHPAPPLEPITVHGESVDLSRADNPYRGLEQSDPAAFQAHLQNGRRVYYQNCFYCHGDAMAGDGMFAHGLNPIPTDFAEAGAIAILQESFLFWRISKGGPGLPEEGGPWDTAMPVWENFLTTEEIWDVVLYLFEYTGQKPRAREEHHE